MNIQIQQYKNEDKESCMLAFKSSVPKFFTEDEINLFEIFLDNFSAGIIDEKYNEKTFGSAILVMIFVICKKMFILR